MSMQKKTLERYRLFFPRDTLKEVSGRTGIQITRVFRLFNGKTMKVTELEALEGAITSKIMENPGYSRMAEALDKASAVLTSDELGKITDWIERKSLAKTYNRFYISPVFEDADIA